MSVVLLGQMWSLEFPQRTRWSHRELKAGEWPGQIYLLVWHPEWPRGGSQTEGNEVGKVCCRKGLVICLRNVSWINKWMRDLVIPFFGSTGFVPNVINNSVIEVSPSYCSRSQQANCKNTEIQLQSKFLLTWGRVLEFGWSSWIEISNSEKKWLQMATLSNFVKPYPTESIHRGTPYLLIYAALRSRKHGFGIAGHSQWPQNAESLLPNKSTDCRLV